MQKTPLLEKDIQKSIILALKRREKSFTLKLAAGPYSLPGVPDILHVERGRAIFIEVKRPGGKATDLQIKIMDKLLQAGAVVGIATSSAEALAIADGA